MTIRPGAAILLSAALAVLAWWLPNRAATEPFPVARINSVSFAAYRPGEAPVSGVFPTAAQVDADLALLAPHVRAVRTYAALSGAADIPALARAHGLKVWQGIWLSDNPRDNAREIAAGIALANRYPDVIERVVVGNEVLLRHDLTPDALIADIDQVRAAVRQPVAYAEVEDYWARYPQIAQHVAEVMVHLLPYWEDHPLGIDRAVGQELAYYRQVQALFPGKPVIVGETGWPSRGRWREDAAPGRVNAARYLREFTEAAAREGIETNLIEAFDQDWKVAQEGTVGVGWGLWTADREPKFPPGVPVRDDPAWAWHAAASVLLGGLLFACGRRRPGDAAIAMALGAALVWAWVETLPAALGSDRQMAAVVNLAAQALMAWLLVETKWSPKTGYLMAALDAAFLIAALYLQIMLLIDPRYRDFPTPAFAVPLVGVVCRLGRRAPDWAEALAAAALAGAAIAGAMQEGLANRQSLVWCAAALLLAAPSLVAVAAARLPRAALPAPGPGG